MLRDQLENLILRGQFSNQQQRGIVGHEAGIAEGGEIFDVQLRDRGLSRRDVAVWRTAENHRREFLFREKAGFGVLLAKAFRAVLLVELDFLQRERRVHRHVGDERQQTRQVLGERVGGDGERIRAGRTADGAADAVDLIGDLLGSAGLRAFIQQRGDGFGEAGHIRRIEFGARLEREAERHQREPRIFDQDHAEAVRQLGFGDGRELVRRDGRSLRRLRPVDGLRGKGKRREQKQDRGAGLACPAPAGDDGGAGHGRPAAAVDAAIGGRHYFVSLGAG